MDLILNLKYKETPEFRYDLLVSSDEESMIHNANERQLKELILPVLESYPWSQKYILQGYSVIRKEVADPSNECPTGLVVSFVKNNDIEAKDLVFYITNKIESWHEI